MSRSQFYEVLHRDPTVVYAKEPWVEGFSRFFESPQPAAILVSTNWVLYPRHQAEAIAWAKDQEQRWGHYVEFLLDRLDEVEAFRSEGLNATHVNPNALCDERVYRPLPRKPIYSAIYVARPTPQKQLELCSELEGPWLWLTYAVDEHPQIVSETLGQKGVSAPQFDRGEFTGYIAREKMPSLYCQSHCSLALSREEGSNYASTEALLCGLPIVACPGKCTRDQMFDQNTAIIVEPNKFAVAKAVKRARRMKQEQGPQKIREITLARMKPHRERFVDACRRAYRSVGIQHDPAYDLFHLFRHQMTFWQPVENVLRGGNEENQELLKIADQEPRTRKLWAPLSGRFWEQSLPDPAV